jgi:ribosomal protein S27E
MAEEPTRQCPLCGWGIEIARVPSRDAFEVTCARCGHFIATSVLLKSKVSETDRHLLPYLAAHTRQANVQGLVVELTTDNWRDFARSHQGKPVSQKALAVLDHVAKRSGWPGDRVELFYESSAPLFDAVSEDEVGYLVQHLLSGKLLREHANLSGGKELIVTPEGWARLEPPAGGGIPGRCFVAMSFDKSLESAYTEGIQPAVAECGFSPVRVDLVEHNEKICDKILAEIRLAQFVVADFTLHRAGVYFESGFAMGLGRPVIWTCRKDQLGQAHFDTRQYNHIDWKSPAELRKKLADRIRAIIPR